jgi:translocation and assembly module TamB
MNDQQIDFKVIESRVYHRNLQFVIDDVPITSQGSVGFDQTLALELTIPIQDRWIDGEDALRGLAGQSLKIPIQGTFQNPRIDERAIADITKQIIRNTARDAIGGEINRQLEKLFQGK